MSDIVIAGAARTPVGSFNGAFATMPAHDLGDLAGLDLRALERLADRDRAQLVRGQRREGAVEAGDGRARRAGDDDLGHGFLLETGGSGDCSVN